MENVVVLVPGFLGFSRFGGFYYFAERLIGVLRGSLEQPEGGAMPVVPVTTLPTNSLYDRQLSLLAQLQMLSKRLGDVQAIHLIGHSTGGVDAQLLACNRTSEDRAWPSEWDKIRQKIKTVITISAPHYGTELADSRFAGLVRNPFNPGAIIKEARIITGLVRLIPGYVASTAGLNVVVPNDLLKFAWQVVQNRALIDDLTPKKMEWRRAVLRHNPDVRLVCFVTGTEPRADNERKTDPFYTDIFELTAGEGKEASTAVKKNASFLTDWVANNPIIAIRNPVTVMPTISPLLNDGVVNSARQIVHQHGAEVGGFVVADHADSMGHYDRQDGLIAGTSFNPGLFHSGAGFEDREFFKLYWRVAQVILGSRKRMRTEDRNGNGNDPDGDGGSRRPSPSSRGLSTAKELREMLMGDGKQPARKVKKTATKGKGAASSQRRRSRGAKGRRSRGAPARRS